MLHHQHPLFWVKRMAILGTSDHEATQGETHTWHQPRGVRDAYVLHVQVV